MPANIVEKEARVAGTTPNTAFLGEAVQHAVAYLEVCAVAHVLSVTVSAPTSRCLSCCSLLRQTFDELSAFFSSITAKDLHLYEEGSKESLLARCEIPMHS